MRSLHYSRVISAIISAAVLVGLQNVMTAMPVRAETTCHLGPQNGDASPSEKCSVPARDTAAFRAAHAEVGDAPEKQQAVTHCVATRGPPSRRGVWQVGIDRATGHRCWRLVGAVRPHPRIVPGAKSSPVPRSSAASPVTTTASARPVAAPATVQAYDPSQPTEVLTGSIAKPSEILHNDPGQSPISTGAGVTSTADQVDRDELQPFDLSVAWTAGRSLMGTITAEIATFTDPKNLSADNILEHASALISAHGRPAIFLVIFSSVLVTILALYALVVGPLKLLRSRSLAPTIRVTPQHYLENMTDRRRQDSPTSMPKRASPRALPPPEALRTGVDRVGPTEKALQSLDAPARH